MFKQLRLKKKITQQNLADILHVDQTTVSKWENGAARPDIITVTKLAEVFGVSVDEVIACFKSEE